MLDTEYVYQKINELAKLIWDFIVVLIFCGLAKFAIKAVIDPRGVKFIGRLLRTYLVKNVVS